MAPLSKKVRSAYARHHTLASVILFFTITVIAAYIFYVRFPNNALYPNFFAEDGQHFAKNILDGGFINALLTPFNGYFIFGIYIITGFGFLVNSLFFGAEFINLPLSFALVSYGFLGMCCALPILLLKSYLRLGFLLALALLISQLPFPSFDYGTFGTIGNLKFAFGYLALILILHRIKLPRQSRRIILVDASLAVCAFTTAGVYLILPFIILSDGIKLYRPSILKKIRTIATKDNLSLWSGLALALVCIAQVAFIVANGLPDLQGYLDEPYEINKTVEVFVARPFLYPFVSAAYHHLNDVTVIALFVISLAGVFILGARKNWWLYSLIIISIFSTTLVFILNRTGTAHYYNDYGTSGFDNFFYAQNFMAILLAVLVLSDFAKKMRRPWSYLVPISIIAVFFGCSVRTNSTYAPNDFMQYKIGTIYQQADDLCSKNTAGSLTFSVYPFDFLTMTEPRDVLCTSSIKYNRASFDNNKLFAIDNQAINIHPPNSTFTQTLVARDNNLDGISVYIGTYGNSVLKDYAFVLMDGSCRQTIRRVSMPIYVRDNSVRAIEFKPIEKSKNRTYCFTIKPVKEDVQQLAIWTTKDDMYQDGYLSVGSSNVNKDVVFYPLYE